MAEGSRVCPQCGCLNGVDEKACFRCGRPLPGPLTSSVSGLLGDLSADGLLGTKLMVGMCIAVYGFCMLSEAGGGGGLPGFSAFEPWTTIRFGALVSSELSNEPWRLASAVFVHGSLLHIGMNMLALVSFARSLEPHLRTARFLILYVLSGVLGFVGTVVWASWQRDLAFSVGASGSIFGLLGALIAVLMVRRNPGWHRVFFSNLILAFALAYFARGIDHAAHIGGFVSGFLIGLLLEVEPRPRQRDKPMAILAGILVTACFASIVLSVRSPIWKEVKRAQEAARLGPNSE